MATIIFDFDGTIADSFDYVADFMVAEAKLPPLTDEKRQELRGLSMVEMARQLGYNWWTGAILFVKGRRKMRQVIKQLNAFEGMPQLMRKLHNEGHELFIVTSNSVGNVKLFLRNHHINKYFLEIYGGVGIFSKSPALRRLFEEQNLDIKNAVYIGDELRDVESAQAIGLKAIAVSWGFANRQDLKNAKPTHIVDTPAELMALLEEM